MTITVSKESVIKIILSFPDHADDGNAGNGSNDTSVLGCVNARWLTTKITFFVATLLY